MKRIISSILAVTLFFLIQGLGTVIQLANAESKPVTWTFTHINPAKHPAEVALKEALNTITTRTNGQIKFRMHQWAELGYKGPEMLKIYQQGEQKIGELGGSYVVGDEPILGTSALPFLGSTEGIVKSHEVMLPYVQQVLDKYNLKCLGSHEFPNILWSKFEVKTIDDFTKLKVRTSAKGLIGAVQRLGGSAVPLPMGEIYQALATGVINSVALGVNSAAPLSLHEQLQHLYLSPVLNGNAAFWVVNKDAFNSLTADVQKVMEDTFKEYHVKVIDTMRRMEPGLRPKLEQKLTIHDEGLDKNLVKQIVEKGAKPAWDKWVTDYPETKPLLDALIALQE